MNYLKPIDNKPILLWCLCGYSKTGFRKYIKANFYHKGEVYRTYEIAEICGFKMKDSLLIINGTNAPEVEILKALTENFNLDYKDITVSHL